MRENRSENSEIYAEDISFFYKKNYFVLEDINWKIEKGQCWGILGHNGAGKTTLSYLVLGLLKPSKGVVHNYIKKVEYLPEMGGFYERLTVRENILFKLELSGEKQKSKKLTQVLKEFGLIDYEFKRVDKLSQGLKKRVALAMLFLRESEAYYFDEPTNALDPEMKKKLRQLIIHLKEAGKIILINSHDLAFVEEICTNFLILNNGKVCFNEPNIGVNLEEIYLEKVGKHHE
ncbi:ABC transporter ATP-binding protein [Enterococcus faecalis]|nr:ABC transporter ATP-binding protein [Enterococcus faecalis]